MSNNPKEVAGIEAAKFVQDGMTLGLGTGSTVHFALVRIAERIREEGLAVRGVPTSVDTEQKSLEFGIPLTTLEEISRIDLTIDGADEIDGNFDMIKGGGGALLREKVVASITEKTVIVVGRNKVVERLGTTFMLPVEVAPFAQPVIARAIQQLGGEPLLRTLDGGDPYLTDNQNRILDCRFATGIEDAGALEKQLGAMPGVVESGLFIGLAHVMIVGEEDGACEVRRRD